MYPSDIILTFIFYLFLIALSAMLNMAESAMFSIPELTLRRFAQSEQKRESTLARLRARPQALLNTIVFSNLLVVVVCSFISEKLATELFGDWGLLIAGIVSSSMVLFFASIVPKSYGLARPEQTALFFAPLVLLLQKILFPFVFCFTWMGEGLIKLLQVILPREHGKATVEEILTAVDIAYREGTVDDGEKVMINRVLDLGLSRIAEMMTPRVRMFLLPANLELEEARRRLRFRAYSRIPVYEGNPGNIIGIVATKDILSVRLLNEKEKCLKDIAREAHFEPESKNALVLLGEMRKNSFSMCMVIDEYGLITGLVTLDDLLEELVGEITTRRRKGQMELVTVGEDSVEVPGFIEKEEVSQALGIPLEDKNAETIAGYLLNKLGYIPVQGEKIELSNLLFEILRADQKRIIRIRVTALRKHASALESSR